MLLPKGSQQRGIGVVDEKTLLRNRTLRGEVLGEDLTLAELAFDAADLAAIRVGDVSAERSHESLEPLRVRGDAVTADEHERFALRGRTAHVERAAEGKLIFPDMDDAGGMLSGNREGSVGGTGVDDHGFKSESAQILLSDGIQDLAEMSLFVKGSNDDADRGDTHGMISRGSI